MKWKWTTRREQRNTHTTVLINICCWILHLRFSLPSFSSRNFECCLYVRRLFVFAADETGIRHRCYPHRAHCLDYFLLVFSLCVLYYCRNEIWKLRANLINLLRHCTCVWYVEDSAGDNGPNRVEIHLFPVPLLMTIFSFFVFARTEFVHTCVCLCGSTTYSAGKKTNSRMIARLHSISHRIVPYRFCFEA